MVPVGRQEVECFTEFVRQEVNCFGTPSNSHPQISFWVAQTPLSVIILEIEIGWVWVDGAVAGAGKMKKIL